MEDWQVGTTYQWSMLKNALVLSVTMVVTDYIHAVWEWQMSGTCMFRDEDEYTGPCHWRTIGQFIVSLPTRPLETKGGLIWSFKYTTGLKGKWESTPIAMSHSQKWHKSDTKVIQQKWYNNKRTRAIIPITIALGSATHKWSHKPKGEMNIVVEVIQDKSLKWRKAECLHLWV
jgi:hypothetical protein